MSGARNIHAAMKSPATTVLYSGREVTVISLGGQIRMRNPAAGMSRCTIPVVFPYFQRYSIVPRTPGIRIPVPYGIPRLITYQGIRDPVNGKEPGVTRVY
jgi:hypothetical protein